MYSLALFSAGFAAGVVTTCVALALLAHHLSPSVPGDGLEKYRDD